MNVLSEQRERELDFFSARFGLTKEEIQKFFEFYNTDYSAYDNHVYEHIGSRIAHWWNFNDHNWFARRIDLYLDYLDKLVTDPEKKLLLVDIGFSIPYTYTCASLTEKPNLSTLLVDKEQSAATFYSAVSHLLKIQRTTLDQVLVANIESEAGREAIAQRFQAAVSVQQPSKILIAASEVIEHLQNPDCFWTLLKELCDSTSVGVEVYLTLPIGKRIPSHTMEFLTATDAFNYLNNKLVVRDKWLLHPPSESRANQYLEECVCVLGTAIHK